ncbi:TetR/AcrR family transcriptional regulator [uncultured Kordia sp.]|uniref:TetR/AcrR family transcriptional regulator n=1 Tax=uncultured Kordia sp. TaxID=507699 RepID=UPI00260A7E2B|nr:TetR/AcrR family transcriptional regulator [uncultured Kordia sp.]
MNKNETKDRILKTAHALFHKQGYSNTGINQIIKEAKVAKASLYYHFATKEELCIAYLDERHKVWNERFQAYISDKQDKVLAVFDFLIDDNVKSNFRGCSFINMSSETPPEKELIFEKLQHHKNKLLAFFESEITDKSLAYTVYALFESAIVESQLYRSQEPGKRLKAIVAGLISSK